LVVSKNVLTLCFADDDSVSVLNVGKYFAASYLCRLFLLSIVALLLSLSRLCISIIASVP